MSLKGQCAIISGASQGFGLAVAKALVSQGAHVVVCARDKALLAKAEASLKHLARPEAQVLAKVTDVSKPESVHALMDTALAEIGHVDILVANAGVHGPKGSIDEVDWQQWSEAIDINLKGTVLQCLAVLPHFKAKRQGKIVLLSGGGATKPMPFLSAYAASKAAIVRFGETLAEELLPIGIDVNCLAPGAMNTRLLDDMLSAGPLLIGDKAYAAALAQKQSGGVSMDLGAELCVFLASEQSRGITGKLISAVWDPWASFGDHLPELQQTDVYTLRRIVPEDRGMTWGEP